MNKIKNIASIGGDSRQKYTVLKLCQNGFNVDSIKLLDDNIVFYDAFILPLPVSTDNIHINSSEITLTELLTKLNDNQIVFGGKINDEIKNELKKRNVVYFDYYSRDEFALKNAEPTALGVLSFVMNSTKRSLSKLKVLVVGYGKCARAVSKIFNDLGASVTAASRKYLTVAESEANGLNACLIKDICKYVPDSDVIINTVPCKILNSDFIDSIKNEAIIIDISSAPYGFDYEYAKTVGKKITLLPSIPGRYFPETAGEIIADTIMNIIEEGDFE
ncbi:MAG: hypothetical protein IJZ57_03965 [Clostridia bacterium]|nr:hypothetical protein [Clostridia bacterium]